MRVSVGLCVEFNVVVISLRESCVLRIDGLARMVTVKMII
jgi:hypothetical protein